MAETEFMPEPEYQCQKRELTWVKLSKIIEKAEIFAFNKISGWKIEFSFTSDILSGQSFLKVYLHIIFLLEKYSNWQGVGQNVARDIAKGQPGKFDAHKLIGHWFNQILYFDPEAVKSFGFVLSRYIHYSFINCLPKSRKIT